jgi:hypothetical protein
MEKWSYFTNTKTGGAAGRGGFHPALSLRRGENSNLGSDLYAPCTATTNPHESSQSYFINIIVVKL